ncbi:MAG TPA: DUF1616 domain-containing protein [Thermoplasmata archaeon]|nr:DUF1616 domain-containing protein [Thermoplasmata archaeon]
MRLHFQEKPWDLYVAVGYTAVMAAALLALNVGNLLAILLVLFVPGYVLVAALFPGIILAGHPEIDWIERIALAFGLSIAVVPLLGLLLNFTPFGIRFAPIVATITAFTVGVGYAAYWRRMKLPPERRLSLTVDLGLPEWKEYGLLDKILTVALAASIVVAVGTLAYVVLTPRPGETFTEFYILGPGGNASAYPTNLTANETGRVIIGIANHEAATVNYTVRVDRVGVRIVYNATAGFNETVEVNRTTWTNVTVTVANGANWTEPYTFTIPAVGLWKVQFLLFRDGVYSSPYRQVHLYVTVR